MPRPGWAWALRTERFARPLLVGSTTTPRLITDGDLAVFAGRRHAQGHPEAGSALYRNVILPEMGRFLALAAYRKRRLTVPTVSLMGGADPGVRPGNATSTAAKRTTPPARSSMARHYLAMTVPTPL